MYKRDIKNLRADLNMLRDENRELKRLLKLAIEGFDALYETDECSLGIDCKYCPFCTRDINDGLCSCNGWKYKKQAEKLLKGE